jgi:hypothetical protein
LLAAWALCQSLIMECKNWNVKAKKKEKLNWFLFTVFAVSHVTKCYNCLPWLFSCFIYMYLTFTPGAQGSSWRVRTTLRNYYEDDKEDSNSLARRWTVKLLLQKVILQQKMAKVQDVNIKWGVILQEDMSHGPLADCCGCWSTLSAMDYAEDQLRNHCI